MLSPLQVEILETANKSNSYVYVGVESDGTPENRYNALCALSDQKFVRVDCALQALILPAGRAALLSFHEGRKQESKAADQKGHEQHQTYKLAIIAGIFAIVAAVIGAILSRLI